MLILPLSLLYFTLKVKCHNTTTITDHQECKGIVLPLVYQQNTISAPSSTTHMIRKITSIMDKTAIAPGSDIAAAAERKEDR